MWRLLGFSVDAVMKSETGDEKNGGETFKLGEGIEIVRPLVLRV